MTEKEIRAQFPLINSDPLAYLDNAATTQKPFCVLEAVEAYYKKDNANPLRGLYSLSVRATETYEWARQKTADFINAKEAAEIVFTRNATESLNLVSYSYAQQFLEEGDEIVVAISEHHSNLLPWQQAAKKTGAVLKFFECDEKGELKPEVLESLVTDRTRLVCVAQVSNIFGRVNPIKTFADIAHRKGALLVCDGAQSVPHMPVDVQELGIDFLAFSGHKMYAPMGIGVLWARRELLEKMPPFLYGGEMIEYVTREDATYAELPHKFEAGTVNAGAAAGLGAAIDFINSIGFEEIMRQEEALTVRTIKAMKEIPHVSLIGSDDPSEHHGIVTFKIEGVHPHDIAAIFNADNIAVRAGHHCAQPLHSYLGLMATTRASFSFYNTTEEADRFIACLRTVREKMGYGK